MNILGIGIATLDIVNTVEEFPNENSEVRALSQRICRGGNVTNTLTVLSQFDNQCSWAGVLCNDHDAKIILNDLEENNVDFSCCDQIDTGKTPVSYILSSVNNGSRSIVHHRDMPELSFAHFKQIDLEEFDWFHFEGRAISETHQMLMWCKRYYPQIPVSIEIEKDRAGLDDIFNLADIYFYSKAYALSKGYNDAYSFLENEQQKSPKAALICAWGKTGAYALIENTKRHSLPYKPKAIIDTIGAGDTFNAGIIQARLNQLTWQDSLDFANKLAGIKCGQLGFKKLLSDFC